ncbi:peptidoglycan DD-metalloendopeptidase family protein [Sphingomonas sp.]|uniref:peptidoglycan DD-metalloendopeptidase family protein n=1 Tax=Sphingomonas sp. TaxID=28214 RepID=UPI0039C8C5AF
MERSPDRPAPPARMEAETVTQLPAPPPAWQVRPVVADARIVTPGSYVVRAGDSLRSIADSTGAGSEAIARANHLAPPYLVRPGQRLTIPGGRYHLVRAGETGIAIARAYGVPWSGMVGANQLSEPYILRVGQRILIPGGATPTAAERAAAFRLDIDAIVTGGEPALAANQKPTPPIATSARALPATAAVAPPRALTGGGFAWPVRGTLIRRFGPGASGERNDGIKIGVPLGTPIRAAADGVVAYVGSEVPALGGLVIVKHGSDVTTVYGHASQLLVQRGQSVKRGQSIALSGSTGFADRPEVHFEIRQGRTPVDPLSRLPAS